jgi:hypothetical protein
MATFIALMASTATAASFSITISPSLLKAGLTQPNRLHAAIYVAEACAAAASLGADGWSTERGISQGSVRESNPLFLTGGTGQFSQYKFWSYKVVGASLPFVATWLLHKRKIDTKATDIESIGASSAVAGFFCWAAAHNIRLEDRLAK